MPENATRPLTARQRELFTALLTDFLAEGFESFTIDDATKRYHCSKSTIYALGKTRDAIIRRVLVSFFKEITRRTDPEANRTTSAARALEWARAAEFSQICGDIMLALPYYSNGEFDRTMELLVRGGCTHISAYLLKIEPGTAFWQYPPDGLPDADAAAEFYLYAVKRLEEAGYRQYEISNFALPGCEGRHNLLYWNCRDYLGIGPAAHSCMDGVRRFWPNDTAGFIAGTVQEQDEGICDAEDFLIMQLRLRSGLDTDEYAARYGIRFTEEQQDFLRQCVRHGYAEWDEHRLRLTPAGMIVQNAILEELI